MIKLVMFDLDGVLVDMCDFHRIALNEALKQISDYEISLEEHYQRFNGLPTKKKLEMLVQDGFVKKEDCERINALKQEKTFLAIKENLSQRQEKIKLLKFLQKKGILLACVTNSIKDTAEMMLEKTGIKSFMDIIITNQDVNNPKPNPEGYYKAMTAKNMNPEDCIIVEDSPKGLQAAMSTGCKVIKVSTPDEVTIELFDGVL